MNAQASRRAGANSAVSHVRFENETNKTHIRFEIGTNNLYIRSAYYCIMEIRELLPLLNDWWLEGSVSPEKSKPYKRTYFDALEELLPQRQAVLITGLRRVGKTTMMYQSIERLISHGTNPKNILYLTFDERVDELLDVFREYRKLTDINWKTEKIYVYLDEIQKLPGWSSKIKIFYDSHPNIKFVISGSASLRMEKDAVRNLAGRYFFIDMLPLSLREYAEMYLEKEIGNLDLYRDEIDYLFPRFVNHPFPEIIKFEDEARTLEYINSIVIEKIVYADLPQIERNFRPELARSMLNIFMHEVGMTLNLDSLSRDMHVSKKAISDHLHYLEFARLIKLVRNFRPSIMAESRKLKRVYPYHIALAAPYKHDIDKGKVYECLVRTYFGLEHYWRKKGREVDFLKIEGKTVIPIEVKSGKKVRSGTYRTLARFMEKYDVGQGILIYGGRKDYVKKEPNISVTPIIDALWHGNL